eukprot:11642540-Karenia_brevis.AAC.1
MHLDSRNVTGWRRPRSGRRQVWEKPFVDILGLAWQHAAATSSHSEWKAGEKQFLCKWAANLDIDVRTLAGDAPIPPSAFMSGNSASCTHIDGSPWD